MPEASEHEGADDPHSPYLLDRVKYGDDSFHAYHAELERPQSEQHLEPSDEDQDRKELVPLVQMEEAGG